MASLLDLAQARLGGLLAPRPSMAGLLGGQRTQGNLASALQGYTPPQMTALTNPQVMDYARNVAQSAQQNLQTQMSDLDKAIVMGQQGIQVGDREALARLMEQVPGLMGATAYHGTPHTIQGKFDISKVGTGEGAQAYGHGMYFAENPAVAKEYQRTLSNPEVVLKSGERISNPTLGTGEDVAKAWLEEQFLQGSKNPFDDAITKVTKLRNSANSPAQFDEATKILNNWKSQGATVDLGGNLYKVDIPDEYIPKMVQWETPLSEMDQKLASVIKPLQEQLKNQPNPDLFKNAKSVGDVIQYSNAIGLKPHIPLQEAGYKGIRYLDEGSREAGKGTSNFVVFDPTDVKILEKNSQKVEGLLD